jgi:hypothetical protein
MKTFTLVHEIATDVDGFWKTFFDKDYNVALFSKGLGFPKYEVLSFEENDKEIKRKVRVTPKLDVPGPIAKLLGDGFAYMEEGTFDRAAKIWRWQNVPADKLATTGTIRAEAAGDGKMRRIGDFKVEGKIFGLGGMLESTLEKNLRSGWDKSATFLSEWAAGKHR